MKGLADYMTASHRKQRAILHSYKYPDEDESQAKILYYREARDRILALHKSAHQPAWLQSEALQLESVAAHATDAASRRLINNARALVSYATHFGNRVFKILDEAHMTLTIAGVVITVRPDMHVEEKRAERLIKLEFGVEPLAPTAIRILTQTMYEAARNSGMSIKSKDVLCFDVTRGKVHAAGTRMGPRLKGEIKAACQNIASIWDGI
ncbi:MAG TPA: hypothetical protein VJY35_10565 [Candidatus Eisenbacteria bacterium]|nr:hypothetical protein [Candidatus Eisenbacteria bacterium]